MLPPRSKLSEFEARLLALLIAHPACTAAELARHLWPQSCAMHGAAEMARRAGVELMDLTRRGYVQRLHGRPVRYWPCDHARAHLRACPAIPGLF